MIALERRVADLKAGFEAKSYVAFQLPDGRHVPTRPDEKLGPHLIIIPVESEYLPQRWSEVSHEELEQKYRPNETNA